jgi:tetratricopeptide (TPR) repeat protein
VSSCRCVIFFLLILVESGFGFNQEDASNQWGTAYLWLQTGRNLSAAGQAPLALGSYLEALEQFEILAENYPDYETDMIQFRLTALRKDIATLRAGLSTEDLAIATEYVEFIKLLKKADEERYEARRASALALLRTAASGLEAIVARRPEAFGPAVKSQEERLLSTIAWLDSLVHRRPKASGGLALTGVRLGGRQRGTTEFIKESDLPGEPGKGLSPASLFPKR